VFNSSLGLNTINLGLRDESENTLHISLFKSGALGSEAFSRHMGGRGLNNMLNYYMDLERPIAFLIWP
jgi:hypothetical protein